MTAAWLPNTTRMSHKATGSPRNDAAAQQKIVVQKQTKTAHNQSWWL